MVEDENMDGEGMGKAKVIIIALLVTLALSGLVVAWDRMTPEVRYYENYGWYATPGSFVVCDISDRVFTPDPVYEPFAKDGLVLLGWQRYLRSESECRAYPTRWLAERRWNIIAN